jgi:hypothetical protein
MHSRSIATTDAGGSRCPCCGRRRRRPRPRSSNSPPELPLWLWAARHQPSPRPRLQARLVLLDDLRDAEGEPRACIAISGRLPLAFPSISAAVAALARMEAAHAGR